MSPKESIAPSQQVIAAVEKFYELNDDLDAMQATTRRVVFEFLRTNPTLSTSEIEIVWTVVDLLADLCKAKRATS